MEAQLTWTVGMNFVGQSGDSPEIEINHPHDGGPSPLQYFLMGIAGCTGMDVASILQKKPVAMSGLVINILGARAEQHPKRFTDIAIEFVVTGTGIKPKDVERAIELSATKYCSALASLNSNVTHSFKIMETDDK